MTGIVRLSGNHFSFFTGKYSSVGERFAARGQTTAPDEQILIKPFEAFSPRGSAKFMQAWLCFRSASSIVGKAGDNFRLPTPWKVIPGLSMIH
jgi:hypothetical protein